LSPNNVPAQAYQPSQLLVLIESIRYGLALLQFALAGDEHLHLLYLVKGIVEIMDNRYFLMSGKKK
jgi:hypothetical protein